MFNSRSFKVALKQTEASATKENLTAATATDISAGGICNTYSIARPALKFFATFKLIPKSIRSAIAALMTVADTGCGITNE